jgi:hypothetical protein
LAIVAALGETVRYTLDECGRAGFRGHVGERLTHEERDSRRMPGAAAIRTAGEALRERNARKQGHSLLYSLERVLSGKPLAFSTAAGDC